MGGAYCLWDPVSTTAARAWQSGSLSGKRSVIHPGAASPSWTKNDDTRPGSARLLRVRHVRVAFTAVICRSGCLRTRAMAKHRIQQQVANSQQQDGRDRYTPVAKEDITSRAGRHEHDAEACVRCRHDLTLAANVDTLSPDAVPHLALPADPIQSFGLSAMPQPSGSQQVAAYDDRLMMAAPLKHRLATSCAGSCAGSATACDRHSGGGV